MFQRPYGQASTIDGVVLIVRNAADYAVNPTIQAGDVTVSIDGGAFQNITTVPVAMPSGSTAIRMQHSGAEMTGKRIVTRFIDQTIPKVWEDQEIIVETFGHASAQDPRADLLTTIDGVETGITVKQALRACLAILTGLVSGYPTGPGVFKAPDGVTSRVTIANDQNGNRLTVTLNL